MGIFSAVFGVKSRKYQEEDIIISEKKLKNNETKSDEICGGSNDGQEANVPDGAFVNEKGEIEYKVVEREIHPAKIICPDCGGITLEGLEYCDKCGGELM